MNNFFHQKKVLVTGAGGFVAGNLIPQLLSLGAQVKCLSREKKPASFPSETEWVEGDVTNPNIWNEILPGCDMVFHLAAQTSARIANQNPDEDFKINVTPVLNLIAACKENSSYNKLIVLFAATATQCGITETVPVNETQTDFPITVYDRHKLLAETALLEASRQGVLKAVSLRLCNLYGPGKTASANDRGILNRMISLALQGKPLTLTQGCENFQRDFLYTEDTIAAFLEAAKNIEKCKNEYFVIGSGQGITLREAFQKIAALVSAKTNREILVSSVPAEITPIDRRHFAADFSLFQSKTGWHPRYSLDRGIQTMIEQPVCVS